MAFEFKECGMLGLYEIEPKVYEDGRGCFFESYNERDFCDAGITERFVQDNQSFSTKGVLRGLHFQKTCPQAKLVRAVQGRVFDVVVDLRKDSPTFGKWHGVILDANRRNQLYVPKGFAHGFLALEDAVFAYKCSDFYHPEDERGVIWNDSVIGIDWPKIAGGLNPTLSEKDKLHPSFDSLKDCL